MLLRPAIAAVLISTMFGLGACATSDSPVVAASSTGSPPATSSPTRAAPLVLGPDGFGALKLGMTQEQATATTLVGPITGEPLGCGRNSLLTGTPSGGDPLIEPGRVIFSEKVGLAAINAYAGMKTPEGIGIGSTVTQLKAAYPSWSAIGGGDEGRGYSDAPGSTVGGVYRIVAQGGVVTQLTLQLRTQDCYE